MKTFNSLALLCALISTASAGCFSGGDSWQDKGAARQHAENACRGGAFAGTFAPGETKRACVQHSGTQRLDFVVQNQNNNAAIDLKDDDCVLRLQNEINECDKGGSSVISGWLFT